MKPYHRHGREVRPFGEAEDDLMTRLRIDGAGTTAIAAELTRSFQYPRSPATVNMRLKALAERDEREEDGL